MERRSPNVLNTNTDWQNSARAAASALSSPEGRWALLSTSLTAMIAGSIAWMAVGTMPPIKAHSFGVGHERTFLPYDLFQRLVQTSGGTANASMTPFGSSPVPSSARAPG